jgi:hypothetical protein
MKLNTIRVFAISKLGSSNSKESRFASSRFGGSS